MLLGLGARSARQPGADLLQRVGTVHAAGVGCDVDEAHVEDFGQVPRVGDGLRHRQQALLR